MTTKQQENTQNITQYGLTNQHICLLQGITLAPERRTGVIRSLGPLTQALLLVMEDKYFDKLRFALSHNLQMLPMSNEIISALKKQHIQAVLFRGYSKIRGHTNSYYCQIHTESIFPIIIFQKDVGDKGDNSMEFFRGTCPKILH